MNCDCPRCAEERARWRPTVPALVILAFFVVFIVENLK